MVYRMVWRMVQCVALSAVSVVALCCSWCYIKVGGKHISGVNILSWWVGIVKVCGGDYIYFRNICFSSSLFMTQ